MCKGPVARRLECMRPRSGASTQPGELSVGGGLLHFAGGNSPRLCALLPPPLPTTRHPFTTAQSLELSQDRGLAVRTDAGAHTGLQGVVRATFVQGTGAGTQGPRDTQSHTKSHDGGPQDRDSAETRRHKAGCWPPMSPLLHPPSAHPSRHADPLPSSPLSLALKQSSCSKLIEFSAWKGPGEVRRVGGWEEAC